LGRPAAGYWPGYVSTAAARVALAVILRAMPSYYRDPGAPVPNVPRRIGVTALIEREGVFLVERRADSDAHEWAFVGGRLGEDESLLGALHREVCEETGFVIERALLFGLFSDPTRIVSYPDGNICRITSIAFRVTPLGGDGPRPSAESSEMRFVSRDELARLPFWPAHQPIRDALLQESGRPVVA
jgi:8-oxo-dGTP pyrophosphatase MutT (NUDIX family)